MDVPDADHSPEDAVWLDLASPEPESLALAERWTGIRLPGAGSMHDITPSHRFRRRGVGLTLILPLVTLDPAAMIHVTPVGVMLGRKVIVTVRRHHGAAFDHLEEAISELDEAINPDLVLVLLMEAMVGVIADALAKTAAELTPLSRRAFMTPVQLGDGGRLIELQLQVVIRTLGRLADNLGQLLDALAWLDAAPEFLQEVSGHHFEPHLAARIAVMDRDIEGLTRQASNTATRVQMLLDATLGAISIRQGAVVKVLSVVATVFLPPTLIASLYGMNFEMMPELHQPWGYPAAIVLMVATAVGPYLFMKWRGWL